MAILFAFVLAGPAAAEDCAYVSDDGWQLSAYDRAEAEYEISDPMGRKTVCTFARSAEGSGVSAECDDGSQTFVEESGDTYSVAGHTFRRTCDNVLDLMGN